MSNYNDDRTESAFKDGWLYTGDVVTVNPKGSIKIVDRTGDLIKRNGVSSPQDAPFLFLGSRSIAGGK